MTVMEVGEGVEEGTVVYVDGVREGGDGGHGGGVELGEGKC